MNVRKQNYTILAIDTSCDETSAAVTRELRVLSNVVYSQIDLHKEFEGVVPSVAKRAHIEKIDHVTMKALKKAGIPMEEIDAVAVTKGPGLAIALEVGIAKAKELALQYGKSLVAVNHMEGHLLASFAQNSRGQGPFSKITPQFPLLGLLVSGGHTQLVLMKDFGTYELLGETLDDAAGEAYDKVAKMLKLGYPGGPIIDELAKAGNPNRFELPLPLAHDASLSYSFSGLKTACLYKIRSLEKSGEADYIKDFCASFQKAVYVHLTDKLERALKKYPVTQVLLGGGVIANMGLRREVRKTAAKYGARVFVPHTKELCADNGAVIATAAYFKAQRGEFVEDIQSLDRDPVLNFSGILP